MMGDFHLSMNLFAAGDKCSILTSSALDHVWLHILFWSFRVVAIQTDVARKDQPVLAGVVAMYIVTGDARIFAAIHNHIAGVPIDVAVSPIQIGIVRLRKIDLEIMKQVVTGDEVVWVR